MAGHRDDVGVCQRAGQFGLPHEPAPERRVGRQVGAQHLQRNLPRRRDLDGQVDTGHSAAAEPAHDAASGEHRSWLDLAALAHRPSIASRPCDLVGSRRQRTL